MITDPPPIGPYPAPGRAQKPTRFTLLDVRFERRLGPIIVQWLYLGSLLLVGGMTVFGLLMTWWMASWAGWGWWMGIPICMAGGFVAALGVRLTCEQLLRLTGPVGGKPSNW